MMAAALGPGACWTADPIGAMLISCVLIATWATTAREQAVRLVGVAPPPAFHARVTFLALKASPRLLGIDTLACGGEERTDESRRRRGRRGGSIESWRRASPAVRAGGLLGGRDDLQRGARHYPSPRDAASRRTAP